MKQIITISGREELKIDIGKRQLTNNIGYLYAWHYAELQDETVEIITSYNKFLEKASYYNRQDTKSKRDKKKFGNRFSYFDTDWFSIKFGNINFVSYKIITKYYDQHHYTLQDLIENLPAEEMIEYLKDNGLNVCPIAR